MNYSTAIFLIDETVRAVVCSYEGDRNDRMTTFKTIDASIKKDDLVIVPTTTRAGFTVVRVIDDLVDIDYDNQTQMSWILGRVDREPYDKIIAQESSIVQQVKEAEISRKRSELANSLKAHHDGRLSQLSIGSALGKPAAE